MIFEHSSYKKFQQSKNKIIIDCGHTPINMKDEKIILGKNGRGPSDNEIHTVKLALEISQDLHNLGKSITLNFCFSDVGFNLNPDIRQKIKSQIQTQQYIIEEYQHLIEATSTPLQVQYNFQSSNSNIATNILKKLKKQLKKFPLKEFLLRDNSTFGVLSPLLLLTDSHSLLESHIPVHETDIIRDPLLHLKRSPFISLYDKLDGILCPGTYMGNLYSLPKDHDVIAIYSRADDKNIGEKVLGGYISLFHIAESSPNFLSIMEHANLAKKEINFLSSSDFYFSESSFTEKYSAFLNEHTNIEIYS